MRHLKFPVVGTLALAAVLVIPGNRPVGAFGAYDPFFAAPTTVADFGATTRPFGVAAGDFDGDGVVDFVVGRTTGNIAFVKGNGNGTFGAPVVFAWKQAFFNAWAFAAADIDDDGKLDVVWGASATSSTFVNDGDVRVFYGNGDGTFRENPYFVSGVLHNAGSLIARIGTVDAGSVAVGDIDNDGDSDVVAGGVDGVNSVVKIVRNDGGGVFTPVTLISQATGCGTPCFPIYFPAISTQNSPWGLAFGDADADGDADLFVGDRALYVYLYLNDGGGGFTLKDGNSAVAGRPNVYLGHDSVRAAVGYTASLAADDLNGDGAADLVLGLHSGTQLPTTGVAHDGEILLDVSAAGGHRLFGILGDVGTMARGAVIADVNGDGARDIAAAEYGGKITLLRQLPPIDTDGDGLSDYVDNDPTTPNAPRLDMNTDGARTAADQLDNDFDTVLGDPEDPASWVRLGDPADPDDDNDGVLDGSDNCVFVANPSQQNIDGDEFGDACDPLDNRDGDGDGTVDGPIVGDPLHDLARQAKIKWASGSTRFVIRIDALGRFFQNEFTQILTDAAVLSPEQWAAKCWENYDPGDVTGDYEPCGDDASKALTLGGGKEVPISLVVIPKQLWTDPPVVAWINDRNDNRSLEIVQHGTYHVNNVPNGDWANMADRNFFSCEFCGLTLGESFQFARVGYDTLLGNYANKWVAQSGATGASPKIDWTTSFWPLLSFSPGFNASDTIGREAFAHLGFRGFSASRFEEDPAYLGNFFSPEGNHHEKFDQFGMFHAGADVQLNPPDTTGDTYDPAAYHDYLVAQTNPGGLTTWLIEEVDWSGRPCPNDDRLGPCGIDNNRENNTVYAPRWDAWLQVLDYVKNYPGGVVMTIGEVALAQAYDNAPTVSNSDQADSDLDGIGDVIDGATLAFAPAVLSRNVAGTISVRLANGAGTAIAGQTVVVSFDADGNGVAEEYVATTDAAGDARVAVTPSRSVGPAEVAAHWDGVRLTADAAATVTVTDASVLVFAAASPTTGQVTDAVTVSATLTDSTGAPLAGRTIVFNLGSAQASGATDATGAASATLVVPGPAGTTPLVATFAGDALYGPSSATLSFTIQREDTTLALADAIAAKNAPAVAVALLTEADGMPIAGQVITFAVEIKIRGELTWVTIGSATTVATGTASLEVPARYVNKTPTRVRAIFAGSESFVAAAGSAMTYRQ